MRDAGRVPPPGDPGDPGDPDPFDAAFRARVVPQFSSRRWRYSRLAHVIARRHRSVPVRAAVRAANAVLDAASNTRFDPDRDGEAELLRRLARHRPTVVLDVGAGVGRWARLCLRSLPDATVHAFELDPATRSVLAAELAPAGDRVVVVPFGLDERPGEARYAYCPAEPDLTSMVDVPHDADRRWRVGAVTTGDDYLAALGVGAVDLLKIDVEAAELRVLRGFERSLRAGAVRTIQFEYGLAYVAARAMLADAYALLEPLGYRIGRVYPDGVEFTGYTLDLETFRGGNFVATTDPAVAGTLGCP